MRYNLIPEKPADFGGFAPTGIRAGNNDDVISLWEKALIFPIGLSDDSSASAAHNGVARFLPCRNSKPVAASAVFPEINHAGTAADKSALFKKTYKVLIFFHFYCINHKNASNE